MEQQKDEWDLGMGRGLMPGSLPADTSSSTRFIQKPSDSNATLSTSSNSSESRNVNDASRHKALAASSSCPVETVDKYQNSEKSCEDQTKRSSSIDVTDLNENFFPDECSCRSGSIDSVISLQASQTESENAIGAKDQSLQFDLDVALAKILNQVKNPRRALERAESVETGSQKKCKGCKALLQALKAMQLEHQYISQALSAAQSELSSRHRVIKYLYTQLNLLRSEERTWSDQVNHMNVMIRRLEQELNQLQFDLDCRDTSLQSSQEQWGSRMDSLLQESEELRRGSKESQTRIDGLLTENAGLRRRIAELEHLYNVEDSEKFTVGTAMEGDSDQTANKLTLLATCRCVPPEASSPCPCAQASLQLTAQLGVLHQQVEEAESVRDQAEQIQEAYRQALDEMHARTKQSALHNAAKLSGSSNSGGGARAMVQLVRQSRARLDVGCAVLEGKTQLDIVSALVELLCDKEEAANQAKLACKILAQQLEATRRRLRHYTGSDVTTSTNDVTSMIYDVNGAISDMCNELNGVNVSRTESVDVLYETCDED